MLALCSWHITPDQIVKFSHHAVCKRGTWWWSLADGKWHLSHIANPEGDIGLSIGLQEPRNVSFKPMCHQDSPMSAAVSIASDYQHMHKLEALPSHLAIHAEPAVIKHAFIGALEGAPMSPLRSNMHNIILVYIHQVHTCICLADTCLKPAWLQHCRRRAAPTSSVALACAG